MTAPPAGTSRALENYERRDPYPPEDVWDYKRDPEDETESHPQKPKEAE